MSWQVFVQGIEGKNSTIILNKDATEITVAEIKKNVNAKIGIPPTEQRLIFSGKELEDSKNLSDYNIDNNSTLFLVLRLPGGAKPELGTRVRTILRGLPTTRDNSCMICYDDDDEPPPLIMPCEKGHTAMHPQCLMTFCWNEVFDDKKESISCPQCQSEWTVDIIEAYGGASKKEINLLSEGLSRNKIAKDPSIIECPGCQSYCERMDKTRPRVHCRICKRSGKNYEFCWHCLSEWKNKSSNTECGNPSCTSSGILSQIQSAPKKEIIGVPDCPSMRLCPNCGTAIEHKEACKHMKCKTCKCDFCFICLRKRTNGSWQCGSYNTKCAPAPVQERVPSRN